MHPYGTDPYETRLPYQWSLQWPPTSIQLVVCEHLDETFRNRKVDTCTYTDSSDRKTSADLLSARYVYRVFEARTGRPLTRFSLRGSLNSCPGFVTGGPGGPYYQYVDSKDLVARLRPFIVGAAG
jgi:hypothetical protein